MATRLKLSKTVKTGEGSIQESSKPKTGKIGPTALAGRQIAVRFTETVYDGMGNPTTTEYNGWIIKQVGDRRFKCTDGSHTEICKLVNKNNGSLGIKEMTITATRSTNATFKVQKITDKKVTDFSGNVYAWNFTTAAAPVVINSLIGLSSMEVVTVANS